MEIVLVLILLSGSLMVGVPRFRRRRTRDPRRRWAVDSARSRQVAATAAPGPRVTRYGDLWDDDLGWGDEPDAPAAAPAHEKGRTWDRPERRFVAARGPVEPPGAPATSGAAPEPGEPAPASATYGAAPEAPTVPSRSAAPVAAAQSQPAAVAPAAAALRPRAFRPDEDELEAEFAAPPPMPDPLRARGAAAFGAAPAAPGRRRRLAFLSSHPLLAVALYAAAGIGLIVVAVSLLPSSSLERRGDGRQTAARTRAKPPRRAAYPRTPAAAAPSAAMAAADRRAVTRARMTAQRARARALARARAAKLRRAHRQAARRREAARRRQAARAARRRLAVRRRVRVVHSPPPAATPAPVRIARTPVPTPVRTPVPTPVATPRPVNPPSGGGGGGSGGGGDACEFCIG
jgi:hypothetical protein